MAATPKNGVAVFYGLKTRMSYSKDLYSSDVAAGLVNWDSGSGASATSATHWVPPEPVVLRDVAIVTGMADTTKWQATRNGVPTGDIIRYGPHTDSVATRPTLNILVGAGQEISFTQLA